MSEQIPQLCERCYNPIRPEQERYVRSHRWNGQPGGSTTTYMHETCLWRWAHQPAGLGE